MLNTNSALQYAANKVTGRKFIVGSIDNNGSFSISSSPVDHASAASAMQEADRLARIPANNGKIFFWAQLCGGSAAAQVVRL